MTDANLPISQLDPLHNSVFTGAGNLQEAYLGPLATLQSQDPYADRNVEIWDKPEAHKGTALFLRDTIEDLAITSHQTHMTKYIMPVEKIANINVQWEQLEYNAHLLEQTPYQTASRAMTSKRSVRKAQLVRMGISATFENDFLATARGRAHFLATLNQMSRSVMETLNAEATRALITGHRYQQAHYAELSIPHERMLKDALQQDRDRFAIVQKTKNALEKLDMLISKEMYRYGGEADTYIIPEEISIYVDIVPPEKTDYYLAGSLGPARVNSLPEGRMVAAGNTMDSLDRVEPLGLVRKNYVFVDKGLRLENVPEADTQMFARVRQIGEVTFMIDEYCHLPDYKSDHRSIIMYDEDIDEMRKITLRDAIKNCGLFDGNGNVKPVGHSSNDSGPQRLDRDQDFLTVIRDGQRDVAEFLFDIAPEHLSVKNILCAARHLKKRVEGLSGDDKLLRRLEKMAAPGAKTKDSVSTTVSEKLVQILGKDAFRTGANSHKAHFKKWTMRRNQVPVVFSKARKTDTMPAGVKSDIDNAMFQAYMAQIPATKKAEIQAIVDGPHGDSLTKGALIRDKVLDYVKEGVAGLKFKDDAPVHRWHDNIRRQYEQVAGDVSSGNTATSDEIAGYMEPGLDLSNTEYEYLYPASRRPNQNALERIMGFRMAMDAAESAPTRESTDAQLREGGQGLGLAGIGMFYDQTPADSRDSRRNPSNENMRQRLSQFGKHLSQLENSGASALDFIFAKAFLQLKITEDNLLRLVDHDIPIPMNFILFRPHMQYRTLGVVKCKRNGGTGFTGLGYSNLAMSAATDIKTTRMAYTTHFRSIVTQPKNLYVQPDVHVLSCEGGGGCRFFNPETYHNLDLDHMENSLICAAVPVTETNFPAVMDISGRMYTELNMGMSSSSQFQRLHYSTAARYNGLYHFLDVANQGANVPCMGPGREHRNRICYQGHQQNFNPHTGRHDKIIVCKGHWTKNVYAGVRADVRDGGLNVMEKQDYATRNVD